MNIENNHVRVVEHEVAALFCGCPPEGMDPRVWRFARTGGTTMAMCLLRTYAINRHSDLRFRSKDLENKALNFRNRIWGDASDVFNRSVLHFWWLSQASSPPRSNLPSVDHLAGMPLWCECRVRHHLWPQFGSFRMHGNENGVLIVSDSNILSAHEAIPLQFLKSSNLCPRTLRCRKNLRPTWAFRIICCSFLLPFSTPILVK